MIRKLKKLDYQEKISFLIHLIYSIFDGLFLGILTLNEFIFIKTLNGSDYQLGFLFQFTSIVFILGIFLNHQIRKISSKRRLVIWTGIITRLPLVFLYFFPDTTTNIHHYLFLAIFLVFYMAGPITQPLINLFLKSSYKDNHFSRLYSYATLSNKFIMLITTFVFGVVMDVNPLSYKLIYPFMGILAIGNFYMLSLLDKTPKVKRTEHFKIEIFGPLKKTWQIIKENKKFRDFQIGFMFYGFGFMVSFPILNIYYDDVLELNYSSVAFYKNIYNVLAIILLPIFGKMLGNIDPRKFAAYTFGSLALFLFFVMITEYLPIYTEIAGLKIYLFMIISMLFHGVFAATMSLLWNIGSAFFCKKEEAADYQAIHISLTGFRAMYGPILGIFFYEIIGFTGAFSIAIVSLVVSVIIMLKSIR
ncbi:MAG: MFS transporter [Candidatus Delongbacteria bacterium]|nr:MFS transporter [Candidatus Delongbacteria bacterium]MBN2836075.1 MFS transporter [Candidatus Delongbacteria bacterium]